MQLDFQEFVPPIFQRVKRVLRRKGLLPGRVYEHPYHALPRDIEARWILDIGANIGMMAIKVLQTYLDSKVVCFEPVSDNFEQLNQNLSSFQGRFFLRKEGVSNQAGKATIHLSNFHGAHSLLAQAPLHQKHNPDVMEIGTEEISLVRLDDIRKSLPSDHFDIVKIDVEGLERQVLEGGTEFFKSSVDTIIIEASLMRDVTPERSLFFDLHQILNRLGFTLVNVFDIHQVDHAQIPLVQMDCVFRNLKFLDKN